MRSNEVDMPSIFKSWGRGGVLCPFFSFCQAPLLMKIDQVFNDNQLYHGEEKSARKIVLTVGVITVECPLRNGGIAY